MSGLPSWDLGERERERKKGRHAWSVFLAAAAVEEGRKEEEEVRLCMAMYLPGLYSSAVIFEVFAWIPSRRMEVYNKP